MIAITYDYTISLLITINDSHIHTHITNKPVY